MTSILAASSIGPSGAAGPGWVAIEDGIVVDRAAGRPPRGARDLGDSVLGPGFIDLQANGVGDVDFVSADAVAWARAGSALLRHGVTAYCPTFVSAPLARYDAALGRADAARRAAIDDPSQPAILGVHLEGPFLGTAPGAHALDLLRSADAGWVDALLAAHPNLVRIVTLAPEADPHLVVTRDLVAAGIVVALGHSRATYDEALAAADAGARVVTHLFNGMGPLHHRAPGLAGAALDDDRLTPTLIADMVHVHPALVRLVLRAKRDVVLVSDVVAVDDVGSAATGAARRGDGVLLGATTLLDAAVQNVVALGVALDRTLELVTLRPAALLGLEDRGRLEPGSCADLVAVDPTTGAVRSVWRAGNEVDLGRAVDA